MTNFNPTNQTTSKNQSTVKILSLISLVLSLLGCANYFISYYDGQFYFNMYSKGLIDLLIWMTPVVLTVIYAFAFYNEKKVGAFIYCIFGGIFFYEIWYSFFYNNITGLSGRFLLFEVAIILGCIIAFLSLVIGLKNKTIFMVGIILAALGNILSYFNYFVHLIEYINYYSDSLFNFLTTSCSVLGRTALFATLLVYGIKADDPLIIRIPNEENTYSQGYSPAANLTAEQQLNLLKQKLDLGIISPEEYAIQRANVINNL